MRVFRRHFGLPLLVKELVEQSARRRTYVIRAVYATALFLLCLFFFYDRYSSRNALNSPSAILGHGRYFFETLIVFQFLGVYAFMPAITCGVVTFEKERDSLGLLFLTRLGPWTILFEKYLARIATMSTFLLLSLPLLGFVYSLGGITQADVWTGAWYLGITVLQVGALALMCSCLFRTTVASFVATYLFGFLLLFTLPSLNELELLPLDPAVMFLTEIGFDVNAVWDSRNPSEALSMMFVLAYFAVDNVGSEEPRFVFLRSVPVLASTAMCFLMARVFLVRRAFVPPRNVLLRFFKSLDGLFVRFNENGLTRGIVLVQETTSLPQDAPVAWRETTKKSLGTVRYLVRIFVAIEFPVAFLCVLIAMTHTNDGLEGATVLVFALWILSVLIISVTSASLVAGERSHQTLDVLLATPMSGRDIVKQKFRGVQRLMIVLSVPLLTTFFTEAVWKASFSDLAYRGFSYHRFAFDWKWYSAASLLSVLTYFPLASWLSFLIGMKARTQARAIFGSLAALVGWCLVPFVFIILFLITVRPGNGGPSIYLTLFSPLTIVPMNEFGEYHEFGSAWIPILVNFMFYGGCAYGLRWWCLKNADRLLGRSDAPAAEQQLIRPGFVLSPTVESVGQPT